jgi:hypothetical protein
MRTVFAVAVAVVAKDWWRQEPCATEQCSDEKYPVAMYDPKARKCVCSTHPCLSDKGLEHSCTPATPYLHYRFNNPGKLGDSSDMKCECSSHPQLHSFNMERACGGNLCQDMTFPVLAKDERGECHCRINPCVDDSGTEHQCNDPAFPVLRYSHTPEGELVCQCFQPAFGGHWYKLKQAAAEL